MKNKTPKFRYIEWKTPDEMHFTSLQWQSEIGFIQDEHRFFEDMLREYTMPIIESHLFSRIKELIDRLTDSRENLKSLQQQVNEHANRLDRLVENVDEPKEGRQYRQEHKKNLQAVNAYLKEYKQLKKEIFEAVSQALKQQKQKRLLT
ncbi:hypothetical protein SAMN04488034_103209 [Salinimicrobium catena]|uniref:Uncharacterized protein n=1 Tax=Salinimicrobium catena TaxID=390640 RepID=A0A1H5N0R7_9FLAO|nr:hypothetical protein [Salinimicrobium catena]SDL32928.1 hypothetical protein SAMN04488140_103209 [Salinimicrobium catena]SEE94547.1 hypothetical protein SAMN04488034_103209 [Salinimicrobium catena]